MALAVATSATGCTSALTSAYLRGMPWERPEHAAESADAASPGDSSTAENEADQPGVTAEADDERRAAAIDEAVSRLTRMGALDESATAALVATLQSTQQEDWPVVIAEFAAALGTAASSQATRDDAETTRSIGEAARGSARSEAQDADVGVSALPYVVAKADLTPPEAPSGPIQIDAPAPEANTSDPPSPLLVAATGPAPDRDEEAHESGLPLAVEDTLRGAEEPPGDGAGRDAVLRIINACFASRVQAWGVVDRFPQDRFRAGREVIVYFELGNLTAQATLQHDGRALDVAASLFRQDRTSMFLIRLSAHETTVNRPPVSAQRLLAVLDRIPDAFVVTDEDLKIIAQNTAFLDLTRIASNEQAQGMSLEGLLGRPEIDRNVLVSSLRQHGILKNFATVLRTRLGEQEDVEVSAVHVATGEQPCFGFSIRAAARGAITRPRMAGELPRSVEQLSQLVGRVSLKELVRETTELVERLCIEAALELTGNNRASAAEVLGVSRQSLYSKLHRYGLGDLASAD